MNSNDLPKFAEIINRACVGYGESPLSPEKLKDYFDFLEQLSLDQVSQGLIAHAKDEFIGHRFPNPIDILRKVNANDKPLEFKPEEIIAMAIEPRTPLGVIARIEIGTFTLFSETDTFIKRQSAMVFLQKLPEIALRAQNGEYTAHELAVMEKLSVSPKRPFYNGLPEPNQDAIKNMAKTYHSAKDTARYLVDSGQIDSAEYAANHVAVKALPAVVDDEDVERIKNEFSHLGSGEGFEFKINKK